MNAKEEPVFAPRHPATAGGEHGPSELRAREDQPLPSARRNGSRVTRANGPDSTKRTATHERDTDEGRTRSVRRCLGNAGIANNRGVSGARVSMVDPTSAGPGETRKLVAAKGYERELGGWA